MHILSPQAPEEEMQHLPSEAWFDPKVARHVEQCKTCHWGRITGIRETMISVSHDWRISGKQMGSKAVRLDKEVSRC